MTPLTNQKLVEAAKQALEEIDDVGSISLGTLNKLSTALICASAPLKEFPPGSGMTKVDWDLLGEYLEFHNEIYSHPKEAAACRQIAEGLSE